MRIDWPRGYTTSLSDVAANQHLVIESPQLADFDGDGAIGPADLAVLLAAWGPVMGADRRADMDNDGDVAASDLAALLASWTP